MNTEITKLERELGKISDQLADLSKQGEDVRAKLRKAYAQHQIETEYKDEFDYCKRYGVKYIPHNWGNNQDEFVECLEDHRANMDSLWDEKKDLNVQAVGYSIIKSWYGNPGDGTLEGLYGLIPSSSHQRIENTTIQEIEYGLYALDIVANNKWFSKNDVDGVTKTRNVIATYIMEAMNESILEYINDPQFELKD